MLINLIVVVTAQYICISSWSYQVSFQGDFRELQSFMSKHRKNSVRCKVIDKKWFIRIVHLWGLQVGRWALHCPGYIVGYNFIIKGRVERGEKDHLLPHYWVDIIPPSSAPPPACAGEFYYSYTIKPELSRPMEKLFQISVQCRSLLWKVTFP